MKKKVCVILGAGASAVTRQTPGGGPSGEAGHEGQAVSTQATSRRYVVEYRVRSSLRGHQAPFTFRSGEAEVTLHLPDSGTDDGFRASILVSGSSLLIAERTAHDALTGVLDLVAFEMKTAALVEHRLRTHVAGTGGVRCCVVYHAQWRPIPLKLMQPQAREVETLLHASITTETRNALYWLRWSYVASTVPEAFFFIWMAVEQLAGHESIEATCSTCRTALTCPTDATHGPNAHLTVTRRAIRALLDRHGIDVPEKALKIRHSLVHGGLGYIFEKRLALNRLVPRLRRAVEEELVQRLRVREGLRLQEDSGRGSMTLEYQYPCEYTTVFPFEPFPSDAPTLQDVNEYLEAVRGGTRHLKIITLVEGPPQW